MQFTEQWKYKLSPARCRSSTKATMRKLSRSLLTLCLALAPFVAGQTIAAEAAETTARCKANESKWYVVYQQEGGATGRIFVCGTAGLGTTEEGIMLLSAEIKKRDNLKKVPVILNIIKLES